MWKNSNFNWHWDRKKERAMKQCKGTLPFTKKIHIWILQLRRGANCVPIAIKHMRESNVCYENSEDKSSYWGNQENPESWT